VTSARFLKTGSPAAFQPIASGLTVQIPEGARDPLDTVIALQLDARP
jgi:hypothetical protein